jgi:Tfp pilus assembly protein PilV
MALSVKDRRGFSLAEIMVAVAFFALSVLAVLGVQIFAARHQTKADHHFRASQKAESVMADIEVVLSSDLDTDVSVSRSRLPDHYNPEQVPEFEYEVNQSFIGPPTDRLKEVQVRMFWSDKQGRQSFFCTSRFTE